MIYIALTHDSFLPLATVTEFGASLRGHEPGREARGGEDEENWPQEGTAGGEAGHGAGHTEVGRNADSADLTISRGHGGLRTVVRDFHIHCIVLSSFWHLTLSKRHQLNHFNKTIKKKESYFLGWRRQFLGLKLTNIRGWVWQSGATSRENRLGRRHLKLRWEAD